MNLLRAALRGGSGPRRGAAAGALAVLVVTTGGCGTGIVPAAGPAPAPSGATGYDKATLARYVHGLVAGHLSLREVRVVGHDVGAGVGFQYAARYPDEVLHYAHLDYPLPGPALSAARYSTVSRHIAFHTKRVVPETVVADDVRAYLSLFYGQVALDGESFGGSRTAPPFDDREIDEFTRTYSRPQVLSGGVELYRPLGRDERDNTAAAPVPIPAMLMTAQGLLARPGRPSSRACRTWSARWRCPAAGTGCPRRTRGSCSPSCWPSCRDRPPSLPARTPTPSGGTTDGPHADRIRPRDLLGRAVPPPRRRRG